MFILSFRSGNKKVYFIFRLVLNFVVLFVVFKMNSLQTNRDVFSLLKDSSISFKDVQLTINKIEEVTGITSNSTFKAKIKKFCYKLQMKWSEAFEWNLVLLSKIKTG